MEISTVAIIGGVLMAVVVFFAFKNRKTAGSILQENNNVVPLMLQKSTQMKVSRLQEVMQGDTVATEQLAALVSAYKSNRINIQQYNEKLDSMLMTLSVEL